MAAALRMPSHYVPVEAEEMEYVEGGFVNEYRGIEAFWRIVNYFGDAATMLGASHKLANFLAAGAVTVPAATAFVATLAVGGALAGGIVDIIAAGFAIYYYCQDDGFVEYGAGLWGVGVFVVGRLN